MAELKETINQIKKEKRKFRASPGGRTALKDFREVAEGQTLRAYFDFKAALKENKAIGEIRPILTQLGISLIKEMDDKLQVTGSEPLMNTIKREYSPIERLIHELISC